MLYNSAMPADIAESKLKVFGILWRYW